jgi:predicted TIM-barrel fold metal-dependent hydrolase
MMQLGTISVSKSLRESKLFTECRALTAPSTGDTVAGCGKGVLESLFADVLMYASDYPHGESHLPYTVEMVVAWNMPESHKRKLFWDNALRYYTRCGLT